MNRCPDKEIVQNEPKVRTFEDLRTTGLLWLINSAVLHPRGFALAFHYPPGASIEDIKAHKVEPIGWEIAGDGSEAWRFDESIGIDAAFEAVEELLEKAREVSK